jgi:methyl-accepting chemotaxis protein
MFRSLTFKKKILALGGTAVLAMVIMAVLALNLVSRYIEDGRRAELVAVVRAAQSQIEGFRAKAQAGKMSEADAQEAAKDALRSIRYGDSGKDYVYIWDLDGRSVMHPSSRWAGQSMFGKIPDGAGGDLITRLVQGVKDSKDGTAFVLAMFPRPARPWRWTSCSTCPRSKAGTGWSAPACTWMTWPPRCARPPCRPVRCCWCCWPWWARWPTAWAAAC